MSNLLRVYLTALHKHPLKTQAMSTAVLMSAGDAIAQFAIEKKSLQEYSAKRTARFFIFGVCLLGPTLGLWYRFLDRVVKHKGGRGVVMKIGMDQLILAPAVLVTFFGTMTLWSTYSMEATINNYKRNFVPVLITNYKVWPAAQAINFYFVPLPHRVLFANTVALFWNIYLSYKTSSSSPTKVKTDASDVDVRSSEKT